jgi:DNA-binding NtrC family response regulator
MRPVDVRVVAASNRDLRAAVNEGSFRADLYYRLAVVRLHLPALRDRLSDLPLLVERLVDLLGGSPEQRETLTAAPFLAALRRAPWRGNVRELRNYLEQCLVLDRQLPPHDLDGRPAPPGTPYQEARRQALDDFERGYFDDLLRRHHNNVADAAEAAGLSRVYVYRILAKHGLLR